MNKFLRVGFLATVFLAACVMPDQRHYVDGIVMVAPPAPRDEVMGLAPAPNYVWTGGYWRWVGDRHEWVGGQWIAARPGRHWVTQRWIRQGDGWRSRPGHWERG